MYRISKLIGLNTKLFHTNDLAVIWGVENRNNLYMIISRYVKKGILHPVYKGLYSSVPISELDPLDLGVAIIHKYTYLSTETILAQEGVINQAVYDYTYVAENSKRVEVANWSFRYRKMKSEYLYNMTGINHTQGRFIASTERAVADLLYYNPRYHFDMPQMIDFDRVTVIQREVGYA